MEVESVRDAQVVVRLAYAPQVLHRGTEVAQGQRPGDLLLQVVEQAVAADPRDVRRLPSSAGR